jgi:hypothetical protein
MSTSSKVLALLQIGFDVFGFFMAACMIVMLGIAVYVWTQEPMRLVANRATYTQVSLAETNVVLITDTIITPQPLRVSLAETNVVLSNPALEASLNRGATNAKIWVKTKMVLINPPLEAFLSGAASNAAIWANGKAFKSGGLAAWELAEGAWLLWLIGLGTSVCGLFLRRYRSSVDTSPNSSNIKPTEEEYVHG